MFSCFGMWLRCLALWVVGPLSWFAGYDLLDVDGLRIACD